MYRDFPQFCLDVFKALDDDLYFRSNQQTCILFCSIAELLYVEKRFNYRYNLLRVVYVIYVFVGVMFYWSIQIAIYVVL